MKYKTLIRLLLKLLGVSLLAQGLIGLVGGVIYFLFAFAGPLAVTNIAYPMATIASSLASVLAGLYFLFGAVGLLNRIIPSNHPYCPECGYDLIGGAGKRCPECGIEIPSRAG